MYVFHCCSPSGTVEERVILYVQQSSILFLILFVYTLHVTGLVLCQHTVYSSYYCFYLKFCLTNQTYNRLPHMNFVCVIFHHGYRLSDLIRQLFLIRMLYLTIVF